MDVHAFFDALWHDFTTLAPQAATIHDALVAAGETVDNDHVAFRTFDRGPLRLDALEPHLLALGYRQLAQYDFDAKKLRAFGYVHDHAPKVFLSELQVSRCSTALQDIVDTLVAQTAPALAEHPSVFWAGRPWAPITHAVWSELADESEYAAWTAAHGYHANHFTVSVNALSLPLRTIESVLDWVEALGLSVNTAGGRVKGSPDVLLEQGSTLADVRPTLFADGIFDVPTCYYEFALRYPLPDGSLYPGFVAASADRIFESTNTR